MIWDVAWAWRQSLPPVPKLTLLGIAEGYDRRRLADFVGVSEAEIGRVVEGLFVRGYVNPNGEINTPTRETWTAPNTPRSRRRPIPTSVRETVYSRDGWTCCHCGSLENLSIDHIHPVSLGGGNEIENLQTLCRSCNSRKGVGLPEPTS